MLDCSHGPMIILRKANLQENVVQALSQLPNFSADAPAIAEASPV